VLEMGVVQNEAQSDQSSSKWLLVKHKVAPSATPKYFTMSFLRYREGERAHAC
jgi:hypothetical protein